MKATCMKAQAAMEYLVTYGWALLALLVVLVALVSSGIFSASHFISDECSFQPNLACSPFILYSSESSSTLQFYVQNGLGFPVKFVAVNATLASGGASPSPSFSSGIIKDGEKLNVSATFAPLPRGSQQALYVQLYYVNCLSSADPAACTDASGSYVASGRIVAKVQQSS